ncbi:MAG: SDR family oxidoreductase, partial [Micromonosporaceae bacterium]
MKILVTGGTGVVGSQVVARLRAHDAQVKVLSRKTSPNLPEGVTAVQGDLTTGKGLSEAISDIDTLVHCATNAGFGDTWADVAATRRLTEAATTSGARPHLVYVSIVGIDRVPYGYYRAKLATEGLIAASGLPWTTLRATQFHELAHMVAATLARSPVLPVPPGVRSDLVESGAVAQ